MQGRPLCRGSLLLLLGLLSALAARGAGPDFDTVVAPLLSEHCLDCHGGAKPKGELDLSRRATALAGGKSGTILVPGKPEASRLWDLVRRGKMPPKKPLSAAEKTALHDWIAAGARWGTDPIDPFRFTTARRAGYDWWALQPLARRAPPVPRDAHQTLGAIDAFVLRELAARGLGFARPADRRTLIRRLSFDLLGLPPTPEEVAAFERDPAPDAYERLVDRYLASPQYGVRWARHWLDVVRFGESNGFEFDEPRPNAWHYRDWVVNALNADLPYDEFVRLQLAGDVLHPDDPGAVAASGFLVAGAYDTVGQTQQSEAMRRVVRQDELEDLVGVVSQTFLGLTANCARCHDHKFDPIRQTEYYQLTAALGGVRHGERGLPEDPRQAAPLRRHLAELVAEQRRLFDRAVIDAGGAAAVAGVIRPEAVLARLPDSERARYDDLRTAIREQQTLLARLTAPVYAVTPRQPETAYLLVRGDPARLGPVVAAGGLRAVVGPDAAFGLPPDAPEGERRRRLAAWITDPKNPLLGRVIVNRLWQHHFGLPLVETPNDFGFNGGRPSHPELLDWLAGELAANGWRLKALHRAMVTSVAYRQAATWNEAAARIDAGNRFLWRHSPQRLEAEALRDAMLAAGGRLDLRPGGPSFLDVRATRAPGTAAMLYVPIDPDDDRLQRRTLYRSWSRGGRNRLLEAFDCPDPSTTAPNRAVTTTPLQALAMLNNAFVLWMAEDFARRVRRDAGDEVEAQVRRAYALAYGRGPDADEVVLGRRFVAAQGLAAFARVLFNSNEFLFVD